MITADGQRIAELEREVKEFGPSERDLEEGFSDFARPHAQVITTVLVDGRRPSPQPEWDRADLPSPRQPVLRSPCASPRRDVRALDAGGH
jgi:hypothetical protein